MLYLLCPCPEYVVYITASTSSYKIYVIINYSVATVDKELYCENALLFDSLSNFKSLTKTQFSYN